MPPLWPHRRRTIVFVGIGVVAMTLIGLGDWASGGHLWGTLGSLAGFLATWQDERRQPDLPCRPYAPKIYRGVNGIVLDVPACWEVDVASLLGRAVHRFHDPDARAGIISVSVESGSTPEEREGIQTEFENLAARPGAIVDGVETAAEKPEEASRDRAGRTPANSLARRFGQRDEGDKRASATGGGSEVGEAGVGRERHPWIHRVETQGRVGATESASRRGSSLDAAYPRRVRSWLLVGDRLAVKIDYVVREYWIYDPVVADELQAVRVLVDSVRPVP